MLVRYKIDSQLSMPLKGETRISAALPDEQPVKRTRTQEGASCFAR
jgi:hypothetical protein